VIHDVVPERWYAHLPYADPPSALISIVRYDTSPCKSWVSTGLVLVMFIANRSGGSVNGDRLTL